MVFVPNVMRVPAPCAKRLKSFAQLVVHTFLSGPLMRCRYSSTLPVDASIAALTCGGSRGVFTTVQFACEQRKYRLGIWLSISSMALIVSPPYSEVWKINSVSAGCCVG